MSKIIDNDDFDKVIKNLRAEGISPFPFITPDFNFSAKFYAAWLRWLYSNVEAIEIVINQLLKREIATKETDSIQLKQDGDWTTEFVITLEALVKLSEHQETMKMVDVNGVEKVFTLLNAIKIYSDGLYSPDYGEIITWMNAEINDVHNDINNINKFLTQIYDNLIESGGYVGVQGEGNFTNAIATGNINFSTLKNGSEDNIIRTHKGTKKGDYTGGVTGG